MSIQIKQYDGVKSHLQDGFAAADGGARVAEVDPLARDVASAPLNHASCLAIVQADLQTVQVLLELELRL